MDRRENQPTRIQTRQGDNNRENVEPEAANVGNQENQGEGREPNPLQANYRFDHIFTEEYDPIPRVLIARSTRLYGFRPQGVILRFRNPPLWTRNILGREILMEMNLQQYFNRKIDQAYGVTKFAIFKYYSNVFSSLQLTFIFLLVIYLTFMYTMLHENLNSYYFIVTKD
ncbi:unnamed protein product [Mucor hiemalis]